MPKTFDIVWNDKVILDLTRREVSRGIEHASRSLVRDAKLSVGRQGLGEPSAPGRPPHRQRGHLVSSIDREFEDDGLEAIVGTGLIYGRVQEFGGSWKHYKTGTLVVLPARPWLRPAFDRMIKQGMKFFRTDAF